MTYNNTLARRLVYGDLDLTAYPFSVSMDGEEWGSGDLVTTVLSSFLQDGDYEVSSRRGNMSLAIPVNIESDDLADSAAALALLAAECEKPTNTLLVDPGDGIAVPTVFDTFRGTPTQDYSPGRELNGFRGYVLRMNALPHGRSLEPVVTPALAPNPGSPSTSSIADGSTTTGWTTTISPGTGAVTTGGGAVTSTGTIAFSASATLQMIHTGSISLTTRRYIWFDWKSNQSVFPGWPTASVSASTLGAAVPMTPIANIVSPTAGYTRSYFLVPASFGTTAALVELTIFTSPSVAPTLTIDQVTATDTSPAVGTGRQQARIVSVVGTARTQGSLLISSPTAGLGDTVVFTEPNVPSIVPALRSYYTSGSSLTTDATTYSGQYNTLAGTLTYTLPGQLVRAGSYVIIARMLRTTAGSVTATWTAQGQVSSTLVGRQLTGSRAVALTTAYKLYTLGTVDLPTTGLSANTSGSTVFTLAVASGTAVQVDEVYLLNTTTGRYSLVSVGTGTPSATVSSMLWLNAATIGNRVPTILRGTLADGSDAYYAGDAIGYPGDHEFQPSSTKAFLACNATDAQMSLSHYPRWLGGSAAA